jgi:cytochrome c-type biogenesis protein
LFVLELSMASLGLAFLAGLVTTLSPCVLPLLPMIAAAATGRHPLGLLGLAGGLVVAFTTVGVAVSASGHLLGISEPALRTVAGGVMTAFGVVLLSSRLQELFARLASGLGNAGHGAMSNIQSDHPAAQFAAGLLMGVAWSPCVGPTLGAAIALAAGGSGIPEATVIMLTFSLATVVPLTGAGLVSRSVFLRNRARMAQIGNIGRIAMGISLLAVGLLVLTGADKQLEAWLINRAPMWLLDITTRF